MLQKTIGRVSPQCPVRNSSSPACQDHKRCVFSKCATLFEVNSSKTPKKVWAVIVEKRNSVLRWLAYCKRRALFFFQCLDLCKSAAKHSQGASSSISASGRTNDQRPFVLLYTKELPKYCRRIRRQTGGMAFSVSVDERNSTPVENRLGANVASRYSQLCSAAE